MKTLPQSGHPTFRALSAVRLIPLPTSEVLVPLGRVPEYTEHTHTSTVYITQLIADMGE